MSFYGWCALQLAWIAHGLDVCHQAFERRRIAEEHETVLRARYLAKEPQ